MRVFLIGATGQGRLCKEILSRQGHEIPLVYDRSPSVKAPWPCEMFSEPELILEKARSCDGFIVCIGGTRGRDRAEYSRMLLAAGLAPVPAVHEAAFIGSTVTVGSGLQAMPHAVVNEFTSIGDWCILNTNCTVDHDCRIGTGVHIMGGASIAGEVEIGDYASIGTNATVLPRLRIGKDAIVGAGAVVTKDVPDGMTVVGVPAREHRMTKPA